MYMSLISECRKLIQAELQVITAQLWKKALLTTNSYE